MPSHRVVVVGAGVAGLSCALELAAAGTECTVLEASDGVGGRVRTDVVDGFRLDRGFQVVLTSYPELSRLGDLESLRLRRFAAGALIRRDGRFRVLADPWRRPLAAIASLLGGTVSVADAIRIARLRRRVARPREVPRDGELTAAERLREEGFSERVIESFFRPFFGGVFLDPELETSERQLELVFRRFAAGHAAVPALGMGELPGRLAGRLPEGSIRTGAEVVEVTATAVRTADGERHEGDAVVLAADGAAAHRLAGEVEGPRWRGVTCLYFDADAPPVRGPWLVLGGEGRGPVNNLAVLSEVAPGYAPPGRALVSVTVLGVPAVGDEELAVEVLDELASWFGPGVASWRRLRTYRIERALPDQSPPTAPPRPPRLSSGVYLCGDHVADASTNGAMASGRRAARAVLDELAGRPVDPR